MMAGEESLDKVDGSHSLLIKSEFLVSSEDPSFTECTPCIKQEPKDNDKLMIDSCNNDCSEYSTSNSDNHNLHDYSELVMQSPTEYCGYKAIVRLKFEVDGEATKNDACEFEEILPTSRQDFTPFHCEERYSNAQCEAVFKTKRDSKDVLHCCDQCGRTFKKRYNLVQHLERHSRGKPHVCDQCGMAFETRGKLSQHIKRHSQDRPYSCDLCGKAFKTRVHLVQHRGSHSEDRPHSCYLCGQAFKRRGELGRHLNCHSLDRPHICDLCTKAFKTQRELGQHRKHHSEDKPHACDQCGKTFKRRSEVVEHLKYHSQDRPHSCDECGKAFKTRHDLIQHLKRHLKNTPVVWQGVEKQVLVQHCANDSGTGSIPVLIVQRNLESNT